MTIPTAQAELPKDSLLEQLRHQLEKQDLEGVHEFLSMLGGIQWLQLENELRVRGCPDWLRLYLKLLRIIEPHDRSPKGELTTCQPRF